MIREQAIRLSGWALMIGAVIFAAGNVISSFETSTLDELGGSDGFYEYGGMLGSLISLFLFSAGMFGLAARYGSSAGPLGSLSLLLGGMAGLVGTIGSLLLLSGSGGGWLLWRLGLGLLFVGLLVFGILGWRRDVLERWRAAPILAGLSSLAPIPAYFIAQLIGQGALEPEKYISGAVFLVVAVSMFLLGFLLQGVPVRSVVSAPS